MNRRQFLAAAAVAAAAADRKDAAVPPVVDTHVHLWDLTKFKLPWLRPDAPFAKSHLVADYAAASAGCNVVKRVYMEVDVEPAQQQAEADYVIGLCETGDLAAAVVSGRPAGDGFKDYAARFKGHRFVKGLRQVLHGGSTPAGYCLDPKFVAGVRLLGELGLSFDLCMRPAELPDAAKLAGECPHTRFVLDHCGNAQVHAKDRSGWKRDLAAVAKRPNVVCKVSGILASSKPGQWAVDDLAPIVNHCLDEFGPERVMFAGDWPVVLIGGTLKQWLDAVLAVTGSRPEAERRALLHDNAVRFYGLS